MRSWAGFARRRKIRRGSPVPDALQIFDCEQGTPEWHAARCGVVTASVFATVMAKGRGGGPSETRKKLLYQLAAETITGEHVPTWDGNKHTERGHAMEPQVRDLYMATCDEECRQVGFMRRGRIGCSPDTLVGEHGLLEIKTSRRTFRSRRGWPASCRASTSPRCRASCWSPAGSGATSVATGRACPSCACACTATCPTSPPSTRNCRRSCANWMRWSTRSRRWPDHHKPIRALAIGRRSDAGSVTGSIQSTTTRKPHERFQIHSRT